MFRRYTSLVFFNPVLILLLRIQSTQAWFLNYHKKRGFLLWSSLDYFPVHQPVATNFMRLQSTSTPHSTSNQRRSLQLRWRFFEEIVDVGHFHRRTPSWIFDRNVIATLPDNFLHLHQKLAAFRHSTKCSATFPGMFQDISRNFSGHSPECLATFPEMFGDIPWNIRLSAFPAFRSPFL